MPRREHTRIRTSCHDCQGSGVISRPVACAREAQYVESGERFNLLSTIVTTNECEQCGGTGWLRGFIPPC